MDAASLDRLYLDHTTHLAPLYARVLEDEGWDGVVIHSGSLVKCSQFDDQYWPLRPVPHFQHWCPLAEPDAALVVRPGRRPLLVRTVAASFWSRPPLPETDAFENAFDAAWATDPAGVAEHLRGRRMAFVGDDRERADSWGMDPASVNPVPLVRRLDELRTLKTPYEVACIDEATRRARRGHEALRNAFGAADVSELDLHLLYLKATSQDDWETPYKNIVALGPNAATLHHIAYGRRAEKREAQSLLVDAGATCRGYCADITRTWIKGSGAAASAFAQLVAGVDGLQRRLCSSVRVDRAYEALHDESHRYVASVLQEVGVLRGSLDEAVARGVTRAFFPHGLGHSLGLQTHDVGCGLRPPRADNPYLRNTTDVARGQVFTIEPGIYFIDALLEPLRAGPQGRLVDFAAVEALAPLGGVRIEDDLHVVGGSEVVRNMTREQIPSGGGFV